MTNINKRNIAYYYNRLVWVCANELKVTLDELIQTTRWKAWNINVEFMNEINNGDVKIVVSDGLEDEREREEKTTQQLIIERGSKSIHDVCLYI